jgi:UDP-N-acetylglucosamine acyltransferase
MSIHPTAIIEPGAQLHASVTVGPYSIVEAGASIGEGSVIESHVRIYGATRMGRNNRVCHGATLGSEPQDLGFLPELGTPLKIGDGNHFKECVNISRGVKSPLGTVLGDHNYFMAFSHVGHDCVVGDHNVFANTATLAGHVEMAHHIFLSGQVAVHQFARIGAYVMVGGLSGVAQDLPPYVLANGQRAEIIGLNSVGLRRNGFSRTQRDAIKRAYRVLFKSGLARDQALAALSGNDDAPEIQAIVDFIAASKRGIPPFR